MKKRVNLKVLASLLIALAIAVTPALAEQLVIKGSTTVLPVAQKWIEAYMKENPDVAISLSGGGSGNGIKALIDGTTHIATASRFIKDSEVQFASAKNKYPVPFRVALDCIVPVVHPSNPVTNLTLSQLQGIYTGQVTDWKDLGGSSGKIVIVSRDSSSGTFEVWEDIVLEGGRVTPRSLVVASNGAVAQTVSKTKGAIGYVGMGYLNEDLKPVKVNNVMGSEATTRSGEYAISRPLFVFTNGWPEGTTLDFINFILSKTGQELVREVGSVPLFDPGR
ncbi:MAG: phosphate ABC transporter substrate-binding protein [Thermodesulfobacteriota bacterium]|nr:phosphate ABC transporter substrate-binding protein [Thermodesulfobacteriota bacterium]